MIRLIGILIIVLGFFPDQALRAQTSTRGATYGSPVSCIFEVRLGQGGEWYILNRKGGDSITTMDAGDFTLSVRQKDINGKVISEKEYPVKVKKSIFLHWPAYIIYAILIVAFIIMMIRWRLYRFEKEKLYLERTIKDCNEELVKQKERMEAMVTRITPPRPESKEEKSRLRSNADKFERVSVLFADIQEFTTQVDDIDPEALLDALDQFYLHFDATIEKYRIEKIRTIGDAYMAAGGLPIRNRTNPIDVVFAALEMRKYLQEIKDKAKDKKYEYWNMRIGIHTGPVVAELTGRKKISYDIWGDTVNIASRMETASDENEITVSSSTYELIKGFFDCEYKGKLPVKYKGAIDMYSVLGLKTKYSLGSGNISPNQEFMTKFALIQYDDLEEMILKKLDEGLQDDLYYHNLKHTVDVTTQVELIGRSENISEEDMLILKTAGLFHDTGFLIGYQDHEKLGIQIAREILPKYNYSEDQVERISNLIFATKLPPNPKTLLEKIICDADLDYLGRSDFIPVSNDLFKELFEHNILDDHDAWNKMQVKFLENHSYYTETACKLRNANKARQLEKLKALVNDSNAK